MLLLGLLVQAEHDRTYSSINLETNFIERADTLLREFQDRVLVEAVPTFDPQTQTFSEKPETIGGLAREAIYYGAESFYQHQFIKFSRQRYREDTEWLLRHVGRSIRPILDIAVFIADRINAQMSALGNMRRQGQTFNNGDLTSSLLISKAELREKFGNKVDAFMTKFVTSAKSVNLGFSNPFAINAVLIAPLIDLGEFLYVPNQYRIFESIYESPFYWMALDAAYLPTLSAHRGSFLEKTSHQIFSAVFGIANVHTNVNIYAGSKNPIGEIDTLVVYGEFILVIQAKSKRVTLGARAGDVDALKRDFAGAIQAPYLQALKCIDAIGEGSICQTADGKVLTLPALPRFFPIVILSDPFPALTLLSRDLLTRRDMIAPVIWDIGVLDCVGRILPSPIEMLFYLQRRAAVFDTVVSDSEFNFLGYHLQAKLVLPSDADFMMLEQDFATSVDDFMVAADIGIKVARPKGVLENLSIPVISDLLIGLKDADPRLASIVVDLYDLSSAALEDLSKIIIQLRDEIRTTGKAIKAFSIPTVSGGLTYAVTRTSNEDARSAAELIGRKHKYDTRSDRWYIILDSIGTNAPIDGLMPLVYAWTEDVVEAENSIIVSSVFKSRREQWSVGTAQSISPDDKEPTDN